jgi:hypothetical protein
MPLFSSAHAPRVQETYVPLFSSAHAPRALEILNLIRRAVVEFRKRSRVYNDETSVI